MASDEKEVLARMASLLKSGATMLETLCPTCKVPLFRLRSGEVVCPRCGQRYVIVSSDEEESRVRTNMVLSGLEQAAVQKINALIMSLSSSETFDELSEIGRALITLLQVIQLCRQIRGAEKSVTEKGR
ncbi:MAG: hypothetical protein LM590_02525 [Thermofilum sp.]|jgi:UPF0148 protein|nr:hypothetical protein [Thermofilum sp.]